MATFFATPADFRAWLEAHHVTDNELIVGYYKKGTGRLSITWPESVDEALCVGWIDGIRRRIDDESYCIRFTPRKARSTWSAVNIRRIGELIDEGRVRPAGLAAFESRTEAKSKTYAYEQKKDPVFDDASEAEFRSHPAAWEFFEAQAPWYRKKVTWWVISAKKEETRVRRLTQLIEACEKGEV